MTTREKFIWFVVTLILCGTGWATIEALFILFNVAIVIWEWHEHSKLTPVEQGALNLVSCAGPVHNAGVLAGH